MSRLFLFAIGGTGARVVKSLTMLLASGVRLRNTSQVIPILMDPHAENRDLRRTKDLLSHYQTLRASLQNPPTAGFFGTDLQTLKEQVPNAKIDDSFLFELGDVSNARFRDYIGYDDLDPADKALSSLLFSEENLQTRMGIGFVGNPNIGSVVLNQFGESKEFKAFASTVKPGDRVFIISSIFGGTGAAGFPIILKNIRGYRGENQAVVSEIPIGALSVQPYYDVYSTGEQGPKLIDNATFISKTKAALSYYRKSIASPDFPKLNALYSIAETQRSAYNYDAGEGGQQNDAHYVELIGAMSIVDFLAEADRMSNVRKGDQVVANKPLNREFGLRTKNSALNFSDLADLSQGVVATPLAQMALLSHYLAVRVDGQNILGSVAWSKNRTKVGAEFKNTRFYRELRGFDAAFRVWLKELNDGDRAGSNKRTLKPFEFSSQNLAQLIRGFELTKKDWLGREKDVELDFDKLDDLLNEEEKSRDYPAAEDKFLALMNTATARLLSEHFKNLPKAVN